MKKLTFIWTTGTANANMIKAFKNTATRYGSGKYFELCADLGSGFAPVTYYCIDQKESIFGITYKPQRTADFFRLSPEELYKADADGWTKEEKMLCDRHPDAHPFKSSLLEALKEAEQLTKDGYTARVLERINNRYAVITE